MSVPFGVLVIVVVMMSEKGGDHRLMKEHLIDKKGQQRENVIRY